MKDTPNTITQKFVEKPFSEGIHDIAQLLMLLKNKDLELSHATLKRCLVIHNARLLEGIANAILVSTLIGARLLENLIKKNLSTIDKFELVYFLRTKKTLDYGDELVANVIKIFSTRNDIIHPKVADYAFASIEKDLETERIKFTLEKKVVFDVFQATLKMFQFLDIFFVDWCNCDGQFLSELLCENVIFADGKNSVLQRQSLVADKKNIEDALGINIRFLSLLVQQQIALQQVRKISPIPQKASDIS